MTLNEKALCRLMKNAHKGGGLRVVRTDRMFCTDCLLLDAGWWTILQPMQEVPAKALALIAEWSRTVPLIGTGILLGGYLLEDPAMSRDEMESTLADLRGAQALFDEGEGVLPIGLSMEGCTLLQTQSRRIVALDVDCADLLSGKANLGSYLMGEDVLIWNLDNGLVRIKPHALPTRCAPRVAPLEAHDFWKEEG